MKKINSHESQKSFSYPHQWDIEDVCKWLTKIKCGNAKEIFQFHALDGLDLLDLNDNNFRQDLCFKRIHDRKHLLREIQNLKVQSKLLSIVPVTVVVNRENSEQIAQIKVDKIEEYSFDNLLEDSVFHFQLDKSENYCLKDKEDRI